MDISKISSSVWSDLVTGKINCEFEFLALKILLSRLRLNVKINSAPDVVEKSANEVKDLFVKCGHLPKAAADLNKIMGKV